MRKGIAGIVVAIIMVLWLLLFLEFKTGTAYGTGGSARRHESSTTFWLTKWGHKTLVTIVTFYAGKPLFSVAAAR
jgi:hypothetical protein